MPKRRLPGVVDHSVDVRKLTLSSRIDGTDLTTRKTATRATSSTTKLAAPFVRPRKIRSPMRTLPRGEPTEADPAPSTGGESAGVPALMAVGCDEPITDGFACKAAGAVGSDATLSPPTPRGTNGLPPREGATPFVDLSGCVVVSPSAMRCLLPLEATAPPAAAGGRRGIAHLVLPVSS